MQVIIVYMFDNIVAKLYGKSLTSRIEKLINLNRTRNEFAFTAILIYSSENFNQMQISGENGIITFWFDQIKKLFVEKC